MNSKFLSASIVIIINLVSQNLIAQKIEWILKPKISECENLIVPHIDSKLFLVKNGYSNNGIKNFKNEWVVDTIYRKLDISLDGKFAYLEKKGSSKIDKIFDENGNEVKNIEHFDYLHPHSKHNNMYHGMRNNYLKEIKTIEKLTETNCKKKIVDDDVLFDFITPKNDTIIRNITPTFGYLGNNMLASTYYNEGRTKFYNLSGTVLKELRNGVIKSNGKNLISITRGHAKMTKVYDYNFNLILETREQVRLIDDSDLFITLKGNSKNTLEFSLYNSIQKQFIKTNKKRIESNGKKIILIIDDDRIEFYNWKNDTSNFLKGNDSRFETYNSNFVEFSDNDLHGVYNYVTDKIIVEPKYNEAKLRRNHIACSGNDSDGYIYFNHLGEKIFNSKSSSSSVSYGDFILMRDTLKNLFVTDLKGTILYPHATGKTISKDKPNWIGGYHISQIGKSNKYEYSFVSNSIKGTNEKSPLYIVGYKNKVGVVNKDNEKIIKQKYERINCISYDQEKKEVGYAVKENGKWGILKITL